MKRLLPALALLLAAACSLPLPGGVRTPSGVTSQQQPAGLEVLPQGPTPGQTPTGAVSGFLAAQASSAGDYAIARAFLTAEAAEQWQPGSGIRVYRPEGEDVQLLPRQEALPGGQQSVGVRLNVFGRVDTAGHFEATPGAVDDFYGVVKTPAGWRVNTIPASFPGLQLSLLDLNRTYSARSVYYLAPQVPGGGGTERHLAPDRVFLQNTGSDGGLAALVRRAFAPPSAALRPGVDQLLAGVSAERVTRTRDGIVTITLSEDANGLGADDLRNLSARLVWTLRSGPRPFTGLRLRTSRAVLRPKDAPEVQPATAWPTYDPQGLGDAPSYYFVSRQRLRSSATPLPTSPFTQASGIRVDAVAVSPRGDQIATLRSPRGGPVEVSFGSLRSATVSTGATARDLSSPTWGSGEAGLWLVQDHARVVRLEPGSSGLVDVPVRPRPAGRITSLAVSRDGTRAALIIAGRTYLATVVRHGSVLALEELHQLGLPAGSGSPTQVVWSTPTEIVVLRPSQGAQAVLRLAIDASASTVVLTGKLVPTTITAADSSLVVAATDGLYSVSLVTSSISKLPHSGSAPAFPG